MCDACLGVISLVNHHGLILWMQAIEEGILGHGTPGPPVGTCSGETPGAWLLAGLHTHSNPWLLPHYLAVLYWACSSTCCMWKLRCTPSQGLPWCYGVSHPRHPLPFWQFSGGAPPAHTRLSPWWAWWNGLPWCSCQHHSSSHRMWLHCLR